MPPKIAPAPVQAKPQPAGHEKNIKSDKPEGNGIAVGDGGERIEIQSDRNKEMELIRLADGNSLGYSGNYNKMEMRLNGQAGLSLKKAVFQGDADKNSGLIGQSNHSTSVFKARSSVGNTGVSCKNIAEYTQNYGGGFGEMCHSGMDMPPSYSEVKAENSFENGGSSEFPMAGVELNPYLQSEELEEGLDLVDYPNVPPLGKFEIEELRSLLCSFDEWQRVLLGYKDSIDRRNSTHGFYQLSYLALNEVNRSLEAIENSRKLLKECGPSKSAGEIFNRAHDLAKFAEIRGPRDKVVPAGFIFFDADLEELALLAEIVLEVIEKIKGDTRSVQTMLNKINGNGSSSVLVSMQKPESFVIDDIHKTLHDGSRYAWIPFGGRSAQISSFMTPVVFWGDLFSSEYLNEPGQVSACPIDWLEDREEYKITVLSGARNGDIVTEPKGWYDWTFEKLQELVQYSGTDGSI